MFKITVVLSTALCLIFSSIPFLTKAEPNKYALIVAIGQYPIDSGWENLSAENDVTLLQTTLQRQGFPPSHIATLVNQAATKAAILNAIQQQLTAKVQAGDIAHFHFSGHGQQTQDDSPIDEVDGLDEALVPYNSPLEYSEKNQGQCLLRDDELKEAFEKVRKKLGKNGHLLVTIDACHSGTATRGKGGARGTDIIMASPAYLKKIEKENRKKDSSIGLQTMEITSTELASMVSLFSSSAEQLSYEDYPSDNKKIKSNPKKYGLFSYAFCKALSTLPAEANYDNLLTEIKFFLANREQQTPQGEGKMQQKVLGIGSKKQVPYLVAEVKAGTLVIPVGHLQNITEGTKVAIYRSGTVTPKKESFLAKGAIDWVDIFSSDIKLDKSINLNQLKGAWVFIEKLNFPKCLIKIEQVPEQLKNKYPFIEEVEEGGELYFEASASSSIYNLYQRDGTPLCENCTEEALCQALLSYERAGYLRKLEVESRKIKAKLEIVIVDKKGEYALQDGQFVKVGTSIKFKISNVGEKDFYFQVFDIQPDHIINEVFYHLNKNDCFLKAKTSYESEEFIVQKPLGMEVFKIVATSQPLHQHLSFILKCDTRKGGKKTKEQFLELTSDGFIGSIRMEIIIK